MLITYLDSEGKYFTWWRYRVLSDLAKEIHDALGVEEFTIRYDSYEDFHLMEFTWKGHHVQIRLYKVFGMSVEGTTVGTFSTHQDTGWLIRCLRRHVT